MLSRKRARAGIVCICIAMIIFTLSLLFSLQWLFYVGILLFITGMWVPCTRCPECKKFFVIGTWHIKFHWNEPDEGECLHCGHKLVYDDQNK